jgi:hypothetical protein
MAAYRLAHHVRLRIKEKAGAFEVPLLSSFRRAAELFGRRLTYSTPPSWKAIVDCLLAQCALHFIDQSKRSRASISLLVFSAPLGDRYSTTKVKACYDEIDQSSDRQGNT